MEPANRISKLYTAAVADVLDGLGLLRQTLPPEIRPLREGMSPLDAFERYGKF
jgi:hypothetical protein